MFRIDTLRRGVRPLGRIPGGRVRARKHADVWLTPFAKTRAPMNYSCRSLLAHPETDIRQTYGSDDPLLGEAGLLGVAKGGCSVLFDLKAAGWKNSRCGPGWAILRPCEILSVVLREYGNGWMMQSVVGLMSRCLTFIS